MIQPKKVRINCDGSIDYSAVDDITFIPSGRHIQEFMTKEQLLQQFNGDEVEDNRILKTYQLFGL